MEARFEVWNGFERAAEEKGFWLVGDEVENGFEEPEVEKGLELKMALPRLSSGRSGFVCSSRGVTFSFAGLGAFLDTLTPRIALILPSFL